MSTLFNTKTAALALACGLAMAQPQAATHNPPVTSTNRFTIEIDGVAVSQLTRFEFLKGSANQAAAGANANAVVRLTRHMGGASATASAFLGWRQRTAAGQIDRRSLSAILLTPAGAETARVNLYNCMALSWSGPDLDAAGVEKFVAESLDVGCEQVELKGAF